MVSFYFDMDFQLYTSEPKGHSTNLTLEHTSIVKDNVVNFWWQNSIFPLHSPVLWYYDIGECNGINPICDGYCTSRGSKRITCYKMENMTTNMVN